MSARSEVPVKESSCFPVRDALYVSQTDKTFSFDELLPSLPVPSLEKTLEKYLDSVKPHVSQEELAVTKELVQDFQFGIGKELNIKLLKKAQSERNWLEKWWEDVAYLSQRSPLLPLCSMIGFTNLDHWLPTPGTQVERSALFLHYQLQFWKLLREERLKPQKSQDLPLSMHQFRRYFNTVRVPGEEIDTINNYFHTELEEPISPSHLIVLHKGHIFTFDAIDEYGDILTPPELQLQFNRIKSWCEEAGEGNSVGAMTLAERTEAAKNRKLLLECHPENRLHMETIDRALFVVVLDDDMPNDLAGIVTKVMAGSPLNRWADKSVMLVAFENGTSGLISDHTPFDGLVPVVVNHFIHSSLTECKGVWQGPQTVERDLLPPRRLEFHLNDALKCSIDRSIEFYNKSVDDCDIHVEMFKDYGKAFLKPYNIHPETYTQFACQLAYHNMHGRPAPTYVTASTRQFYHGRTETMRSCFPEVVEWVKAMIEDVKPAGEKLLMLQKAAGKFKQLMKHCTENEGCDRHLMGLYMVSVEEGIDLPEIFTDPSWIKSGGGGNFVLSTSCVGYTPLGGGVMPMREDGYGTFYNIENNRFTFTITAFKRCPETSTAKFFLHIESALRDMQQLLLTAKL